MNSNQQFVNINDIDTIDYISFNSSCQENNAFNPKEQQDCIQEQNQTNNQLEENKEYEDHQDFQTENQYQKLDINKQLSDYIVENEKLQKQIGQQIKMIEDLSNINQRLVQDSKNTLNEKEEVYNAEIKRLQNIIDINNQKKQYLQKNLAFQFIKFVILIKAKKFNDKKSYLVLLDKIQNAESEKFKIQDSYEKLRDELDCKNILIEQKQTKIFQNQKEIDFLKSQITSDKQQQKQIEDDVLKKQLIKLEQENDLLSMKNQNLFDDKQMLVEKLKNKKNKIKNLQMNNTQINLKLQTQSDQNSKLLSKNEAIKINYVKELESEQSKYINQLNIAKSLEIKLKITLFGMLPILLFIFFSILFNTF